MHLRGVFCWDAESPAVAAILRSVRRRDLVQRFFHQLSCRSRRNSKKREAVKKNGASSFEFFEQRFDPLRGCLCIVPMQCMSDGPEVLAGMIKIQPLARRPEPVGYQVPNP